MKICVFRLSCLSDRIMTEFSKSSYMGMYGHINEFSDSSAFSRMQQQYWTTKQAVFKKLGKKDDDCIIASDLELDLKLELFQTIEESFLTLMRVLENYQDKLCVLAQDENALGRFLKENGKQDKTRAGKAMGSAGKSLSYSAQQRLTLRIPLVRLYQEVETFQYRAIVDTLKTIEKMEKARTAYRGSLMWMKDISQQLDPDTCKQMEKFRKVQSQVRTSKVAFDNLKLDTLQKIDLLSFSRCNLFSQALAAYQNALLNVCQKIASTSNSVATATKGYQHYEFSMLKELTETSKKLAEEASDLKPLPVDDKDTALFFEAEYHDEVDRKVTEENPETKKNLHTHSDSPLRRSNKNSKDKILKKNKSSSVDNAEKVDSDLISLTYEESKQGSVINQQLLLNESERKNIVNRTNDLLTDVGETHNSANDEFMLLNEIVNLSNENTQEISDFDGSFMSEWQAVFGHETSSPSKSSSIEELTEKMPNSLPSFLPSQLLNINADFKDMQIHSAEIAESGASSETQTSNCNNKNSSIGRTAKGKQDMSAWFKYFADLDPLANPDLIGKKKDNQDEGSC